MYYGVYYHGSQIGSQGPKIIMIYKTKAEALRKSRSFNKGLNPQERSYYKRKYTVRQIKKEPATDNDLGVMLKREK